MTPTVTPEKYVYGSREYDRISSIVKIINKPELYYFYGKYGNEEARKIGASARELGTRVHKLAEEQIENESDSLLLTKDEVNPYSAWKEWKKRYSPTKLNPELYLRSDTYSIAGRCDLGCDIKDYHVIADYKVSKDIYPEYVLQISAYGAMAVENKIYPSMPYGQIIRLRKDIPFPVVVTISPKQMTFAWETFLALRQVFIALPILEKMIKAAKKKDRMKNVKLFQDE